MHQVWFGAREEVEESLACAAGLANDGDDYKVSEDGNHTTIIWLGRLFCIDRQRLFLLENWQ